MSNAVNTNEENPAQSSELHGVFVLPNRLANPIVRSNWENILLLLEPAVVDVGCDDDCRHVYCEVHRCVHEYVKHSPTPPSVLDLMLWLEVVALARLYQKVFSCSIRAVFLLAKGGGCCIIGAKNFWEVKALKMNGARALLESLKNEGVELVFGYPGGVVLKLYDEIYKMKFPNILTGHEQGAVHAADGYARASGKVGVVIATSGPGAANLITGIATAYMDSIPLVCITGQVANHAIGKDSFQEVDVCGITTPITKHNYLVKDVHELPRVVKEAFFIARTGRQGPVSIDIAADVFNAECDFNYPETINLRGYSGKNPVAEVAIEEVVKAVEACSRPLIFVGGGVVSSETSDDLRAIVKRLGCPSTSTLM